MTMSTMMMIILMIMMMMMITITIMTALKSVVLDVLQLIHCTITCLLNPSLMVQDLPESGTTCQFSLLIREGTARLSILTVAISAC